tara:strand:+ start:698 stop:904 length:207 start_codon:yes stop_codon:yes gene_type:complete
MRWSSVNVLVRIVSSGIGVSTFELCDIHAKLVSLLQDTLATLLNESIELDSELCHAVAQFIEAEIDTW